MKEKELAGKFEQALTDFRFNGKPLPGIATPENIAALVAQLIESEHRIRYVSRIAERPISPRRLDPKDELFDPLRAAIAHMRAGNEDEGFWLVFLFVHFGKDLKYGYGLLRAIYGAFEDQFTWTWEKYSQKPSDFSLWFHDRLPQMERVRAKLKFGNHRKYESINQTEQVFESYLSWVGPDCSHAAMLGRVTAEVGDDPKRLFDHLFGSMYADVFRFGRTGAFDYLTMLGKTGLARIEAPSAYMAKATGPARGVRLLFGGDPTYNIPARNLDGLAIELGGALEVGMQIIEDALCNWQKSPGKFIAFRG
ncbi:hypothetical protein C265_12551 [Cupriavidus sp. GA3-3]|uniref:alpha-glutamyl/putrescinyl thymine pyrophosphorylase clade 3 protein n=1 Tax=Cupriavidus sp. GA3-3 TaxID=1229514 RepID=UPI00032F34AF|nr:hypothetical protein [Cupriavidus sp. GA3-3]EON19379.1 hypothetical protein C265_12551 [Cupriavidus sp. GA3-3]